MQQFVSSNGTHKIANVFRYLTRETEPLKVCRPAVRKLLFYQGNWQVKENYAVTGRKLPCKHRGVE
jgi:hypothetical protein